MRKLLFALIIVVGPALAQSAEKWQTYRNDKYNYEVRYPASYEMIITGAEEERDGRTIRIALKGDTRMNGIDINIHPGMALEQIMSEIKAPELSALEPGPVDITTKLHRLTWQKDRIHDMPAIRMLARSAENGELFMISLVINQVVFIAHLLPDRGLDEKVAEQIILTFNLLNEFPNKTGAGDGK